MKWEKGQSGNPKGRTPGYQSFVDRAKYLVETHTIGGIKAIVKDEAQFDKLSVYDGMIMRRVVEAVEATGGRSMDSLLDRLMGKPPQHVKQEVEATVEHRAVSATAEWLEGLIGVGQAKPHKEPRAH